MISLKQQSRKGADKTRSRTRKGYLEHVLLIIKKRHKKTLINHSETSIYGRRDD